MVPFPLHHGAVGTPPWWRFDKSMVEFFRHHGEIFPPPWCFFEGTKKGDPVDRPTITK